MRYADLINSISSHPQTSIHPDVLVKTAAAQVRQDMQREQAEANAYHQKISAVRQKLSEGMDIRAQLAAAIATGALNPNDPQAHQLYKISEDIANAAAEEMVEGDAAEQQLEEMLIEAASQDPELAAELINEAEGLDSVTGDEVEELADKVAHVLLGNVPAQDAAALQKTSSGWSNLTNTILVKMAHVKIELSAQG